MLKLFPATEKLFRLLCSSLDAVYFRINPGVGNVREKLQALLYSIGARVYDMDKKKYSKTKSIFLICRGYFMSRIRDFKKKLFYYLPLVHIYSIYKRTMIAEWKRWFWWQSGFQPLFPHMYAIINFNSCIILISRFWHYLRISELEMVKRKWMRRITWTKAQDREGWWWVARPSIDEDGRQNGDPSWIERLSPARLPAPIDSPSQENIPPTPSHRCSPSRSAVDHIGNGCQHHSSRLISDVSTRRRCFSPFHSHLELQKVPSENV